jgi:hypothetical protein
MSSFSSSATSPTASAHSPSLLAAPSAPPPLPRPNNTRALPAGTQPFSEAVMDSMSLDLDLSPIDLVSLHQEQWVSLRLSADMLAHPEHQRRLIQRRLASDVELLRAATDCMLKVVPLSLFWLSLSFSLSFACFTLSFVLESRFLESFHCFTNPLFVLLILSFSVSEDELRRLFAAFCAATTPNSGDNGSPRPGGAANKFSTFSVGEVMVFNEFCTALNFSVSSLLVRRIFDTFDAYRVQALNFVQFALGVAILSSHCRHLGLPRCKSVC